MGFGILFIGYFFFLGIGYFAYTDALAAAIMLIALYKLSWVNKYFKYAMIFDGILCAVGACELAYEVYSTIGYIPNATVINSSLGSVRSAAVCIVTVLMLTGMREVAREVGISDTAKRSRILIYPTAVIYFAALVLEALALFNIKDARIPAAITVLNLLLTFSLTVFILIEIYRCYMKIGMPGESDTTQKKSRFGFVDAFRRHEEEKQREYAEYKLEKFKQKQNKRKQKENKK